MRDIQTEGHRWVEATSAHRARSIRAREDDPTNGDPEILVRLVLLRHSHIQNDEAQHECVDDLKNAHIGHPECCNVETERDTLVEDAAIAESSRDASGQLRGPIQEELLEEKALHRPTETLDNRHGEGDRRVEVTAGDSAQRINTDHQYGSDRDASPNYVLQFHIHAHGEDQEKGSDELCHETRQERRILRHPGSTIWGLCARGTTGRTSAIARGAGRGASRDGWNQGGSGLK
mmetsp:Transcript_7750/g.21672  ORF Transcript_7750/g.21672 Transcript_7750/m.21672 type:complete len:233 (+) Transcript_7750:1102-1800(+)